MSRLLPRKLAASLVVILPLFLAGCSGGDAAKDPCKVTKMKVDGKNMSAARERAKRSLEQFKKSKKKKFKKPRFLDQQITCKMPEPAKTEPPPASEATDDDAAAAAAAAAAEDTGAIPKKERPPRPSCEVVVKFCPK